MNHRRVQRGVPTGGQFAAGTHSEAEIQLVESTSLDLAHYAEALSDLEGLDTTDVGGGEGDSFRVAAYRERLRLLADGNPATDRLVSALGEPPFAHPLDFDPVADSEVDGIVDVADELQRPIFHSKKGCVRRNPDHKSARRTGKFYEVFSDRNGAFPCRGCAADLVEPAEKYSHRLDWIAARESAVTAVESMAGGRPADLDATASAVLGVHDAIVAQNGRPVPTSVFVGGPEQETARNFATELSAAVAERCEANGARKATEFDAAMMVALHSAEASSGDPGHKDDLRALADALDDGTPVDQLATVAAQRRDGLFTRRSTVEARLQALTEEATVKATRIHTGSKTHGRGHFRSTRLQDVGGLARRLIATHPVQITELGGVHGTVAEFAGAVSDHVHSVAHHGVAEVAHRP